MKKVFFLSKSILLVALLIGTASCSDEFLDNSISDPASIPLFRQLDIEVLSLNWVDGKTCPGEELELRVTGGIGPYNWTISGGTLLSGQGSSTVRVRTHESPESANDIALHFRVNDSNRGQGSISGWADEQTCRFLCEQYPQSGLCVGLGEGD